MFQHAHHAKVSPSFCKAYGRIGAAIQEALNEYKREVEEEVFPGNAYSPYKLLKEEKEKFDQWSKEHYQRLETATKRDEENSTTATAAAQGETIKVY
jgi:hypothetical protein